MKRGFLFLFKCKLKISISIKQNSHEKSPFSRSIALVTCMRSTFREEKHHTIVAVAFKKAKRTRAPLVFLCVSSPPRASSYSTRAVPLSPPHAAYEAWRKLGSSSSICCRTTENNLSSRCAKANGGVVRTVYDAANRFKQGATANGNAALPGPKRPAAHRRSRCREPCASW